jgi:hypothetical protein
MGATPATGGDIDLDVRERDELRERFRRETLAAQDHYRSTGLHLDETEIDSWVARLEAGEDVDPPECHV